MCVHGDAKHRSLSMLLLFVLMGLGRKNLSFPIILNFWSHLPSHCNALFLLLQWWRFFFFLFVSSFFFSLICLVSIFCFVGRRFFNLSPSVWRRGRGGEGCGGRGGDGAYHPLNSFHSMPFNCQATILTICLSNIRILWPILSLLWIAIGMRVSINHFWITWFIPFFGTTLLGRAVFVGLCPTYLLFPSFCLPLLTFSVDKVHVRTPM